jgi:hypothetical protein
MPSADQTIRSYVLLAEHFERQNEGPMRDRFLVLAADAALTAGLAEEAERVRIRLLQHNPHHLLRPFASMPEAMKSPDVESYIAGLRRSYPPGRADQLLESLRPEKKGAGPGEGPPPAAKDAAAPPAEAPNVLKVYKFQDTNPNPGKPAARPDRAAEAAPQARPPAAASPRADRAPAGKRVSPTPDHFPVVASEVDERDPLLVSRWVASVLFWLLLLAGLGLAVYTLGRPFLPL